MNIGLLLGVVGMLMTGVVLSKSVNPIAVNQIRSNKVDNQIVKMEKRIYDRTSRYIILEKSYPADINRLITKGYFPSQGNTNGFGGSYSFTIDSRKGTMKISTDIRDSGIRTAFINSNKNTFKPVQVTGTNTVETTFAFTNDIVNNEDNFMTGVPVSSTRPSASRNKYWYDTSGATAVLKVSDGTNWTTRQMGASTTTNLGTISTSTRVLPASGAVSGDVKYVYDSRSNSVQSYTYTGSSWVLSGGGSSNYKYIKLVNGVRQWSDNSYRTSCNTYKNSGSATYNYSGETGDGVYTIDPDGSGGNRPFQVYCDMTTDGGGWTLVTKFSSGTTYNPYSIWTGTTDYVVSVPDKLTKNTIFMHNLLTTSIWNNVTQIKVEIIKSAIVQKNIIFNRNGYDYLSWFIQSNIVSSSWTDGKTFNGNSFALSSLAGGRYQRMFAADFYGGCPGDAGLITLTYALPNDNCFSGGWYTGYGIPVNNRIIYSTISTSASFRSSNIGFADSLVVYTK